MRLEKEAKVKAFAVNRSKLERITKTEAVLKNKKFGAHLDKLIAHQPTSLVFLQECIEEALRQP